MMMMIIITKIIINYLRALKRAGSAKPGIDIFIKRAYDSIIKTEPDFTASDAVHFEICWQTVNKRCLASETRTLLGTR
jgi:hypothetical protein